MRITAIFIMFWEILIGELSSWIQMSFKHYAMQEAKQQFVEYDKNSDGAVSWDEYNIQMYDRVIDFDENTALDDAEEESFRQVSTCTYTSCPLRSLHVTVSSCCLGPWPESDWTAVFSRQSPAPLSGHLGGLFPL